MTFPSGDVDDGDGGYSDGDDEEGEDLSFPAKLLAGGHHLPVCQTEVGRLNLAGWSSGWKI